ncbi:MAG TPA: hypothetical protein DEA08_09255 [Planctomycetes bacterium]|mgnify:CR=1 FL=1|nr:hypothetical protein [Planctomycetota bacterium]|tara:strand:- start:269 stop:577 length:309 start_codon:yes stop_codon:yes gene_type:complete
MQSTHPNNVTRIVVGTVAAVVLGCVGAVAAYVVTLIASVPANMLVNGSYEGWAIPAAGYYVAMGLGFSLPFGGTLALLRASLQRDRRSPGEPPRQPQALLRA